MKQSTATAAPASAKPVGTAPRPKDSASGWATDGQDRAPRREVVTGTGVAHVPAHALPDWIGMPANRHSSMPSGSRRAERPCRVSNRTAS